MVSPVLAQEDSGGLPQLDFTTWPTQIFWLMVSFALAYVLMWKLVTPQIASVLEDRHARLEDDMQRTRQAADEAEEMRLNFEKTLTDARAQASEQTRTSTAEAIADAEQKTSEASQRLGDKINKAEAKIMQARKEALKELDDVAVNGAIDAVATLTGIKISKADAGKAVQAIAKTMTESS